MSLATSRDTAKSNHMHTNASRPPPPPSTTADDRRVPSASVAHLDTAPVVSSHSVVRTCIGPDGEVMYVPVSTTVSQRPAASSTTRPPVGARAAASTIDAHRSCRETTARLQGKLEGADAECKRLSTLVDHLEQRVSAVTLKRDELLEQLTIALDVQRGLFEAIYDRFDEDGNYRKDPTDSIDYHWRRMFGTRWFQRGYSEVLSLKQLRYRASIGEKSTKRREKVCCVRICWRHVPKFNFDAT